MIKISNFVFSVLRPFYHLIVIILFTSLIWALDLSFQPYLIKLMLDKLNFLNQATILYELSPVVILYISISLIVNLSFRFYDFIWLKLHTPLKRHIINVLTQRLMQHSNNFFNNNFVGNISNKINDITNSIPDLIKLFVVELFSKILAVSIAIYTSSIISYKIATALFIWTIIFILGSILLSKKAKNLSYKAAETRSVVAGNVIDIINNINNIRLFCTNKTESKKLLINIDQYVNAEQLCEWYFLKIFTFQCCSFVIYNAISIVCLMIGFKEGNITIGDFSMILTINLALVNVLWSISKNLGKIAELVGIIKQGLNLILSTIEIVNLPQATNLIIYKGKIEFKNIYFSYDGVKPIFNNESVIIEGQKKTGLVGYSGSGKTTFVNLILRLFELNKGQILIDNQDIKTIKQESLRANIAVIPQDPSLFHRSLLENIGYGNIYSTNQEIIEAAKIAKVHHFISNLPKGYNSVTGERGVKLSGGQRQLIAIARAILKNAPIIVFDEATSQLDSLTEAKIQKSLVKLIKDRTTIVIAHRLSTLLQMDKILVFNDGKIVEQGSHHELIKKNGLYKNMWNSQIGGFLPDMK